MSNPSAIQDPVWTNQDWLAGHCSCAEIGRSKYETRSTLPDVQRTSPVALGPMPSDEELALEMATLNQAALRAAREAYGGDYVAFFKANPYFHQKYLLGMQRQAVKPPSSTKLEVHLNWIKPGRLSYREKFDVPQLTDDTSKD